MSDQLLERAARALSAKYAPESAGSDEELGLRRLEQHLDTSGRGRSRFRVTALAFAVSLVGLTAWSASDQLAGWFREKKSDGVAPPSGPIHHEAVAVPADPQVAAPAPLSSADPTEEIALAPPPRPTGAGSFRAREVSSKTQVRSTAVDAPPDLDALYGEAHEAHFIRRDWNVALNAWERYMAAAGSSGRMILEARYNRAIALVRLGRNDEARAALEPFARGEFGGYRREDARRLLDSLH
jgi:hypothetical protein